MEHDFLNESCSEVFGPKAELSFHGDLWTAIPMGRYKWFYGNPNIDSLNVYSRAFFICPILLIVILLYISDDKSLINNYRLISILNVLSKLIECIVHQQLSKYLEKNNLFSPFQFSIRRSRSTKKAVTQLTDFIRFNMDKGCFTAALYMDLRKAFDTVRHGRLLNKF